MGQAHHGSDLGPASRARVGGVGLGLGLGLLVLIGAACGGAPDEHRVDARGGDPVDSGGGLVDAAIDAPTDTGVTTACDACGVGTICVQRFDGVCGETFACVETDVECPDNACSKACEAALCEAPYQCQNRPPCGTEVAGAFTCYGP